MSKKYTADILDSTIENGYGRINLGQWGVGIGSATNPRAGIETDSDAILKNGVWINNNSSVYFADTVNNYGTSYAYIWGNGNAGTSFLAFDTNAGRAMTINNSRNVGIGTTSPASLLHIYDSSSAEIKLETTAGSALLRAISDTLVYRGDSHIFQAENGTERMRIDSSGVIHSKAGSSTNDNVRFYNQDGNYSYIRQTAALNSNNVWFDGTLGSTMWYAWDNPGNLRTAGVYTKHMFGSGRGTGAEIFTINRADISGTDSTATTKYTISPQGNSYFNGGNVGIGETNPSYKLHVVGEAQLGFINFEYNENYAGVRWKNSSQNLVWKIGNDTPSGNWLYLYDYAKGASAFTFKPNSDMCFTPTGNVGIGTTSPVAPLHIGNGTSQQQWITNQSVAGWYSGIKLARGTGNWSGTGNNNFGLVVTDAGLEFAKFTTLNDAARITYGVIDGTGNWGIGTTNPETKLHIVTNNVGVKTAYADAMIEDVDAQLDIISNSDGTWGSAINFVEGAGASNTDIWSIARKTTGGLGNSSLNFNFGTANEHANSIKVTMLSSGGITFNGDTSAANALDDYEEGTWTPNYYGDSTAGTVSYSGRGGTYTKIGNQVTVWFSILNYSVTGAAGNLIIGGLPFTPNFTNSVRGAFSGNIRTYNVDWPDGYSNILINLGNADSYMSIMMIRDNGTWANLQVENGSNQYIEGYVTYTV